jgi:hypothetical protein
MNVREIRNIPPIPIRELEELSRNRESHLWADQPSSDWCQFHAHIWDALRTNDWSQMPFDPARLMLEAEHDSFAVDLGAFAGLSDALTLGGKWQHPADAIFDFRAVQVMDSGHAFEFWKFWGPMLEEYEAWAGTGAIGMVLPLPMKKALVARTFDSSSEAAELTGKFHGGWDSMHLTTHAWRPFRRTFHGVDARVEVTGDGFYRVMTSNSYAGWARSLFELSVETLTLIRLDVNVGDELHGAPVFVTLGHVLLKPVPQLISTEDDRYDESEGPARNSVRYLNDSQAQALLDVIEGEQTASSGDSADQAQYGSFFGFTFVYTIAKRPSDGALYDTAAVVLVTDGTQHRFILPERSGGNWYRLEEDDIEDLIFENNLFSYDEAGIRPADVAQLVLDRDGERVRLLEKVRVFESSDAMENVRLMVKELFEGDFCTARVVPGNIEFSRE